MMALAVLTQPYPARVKEQFWFRELRQAVAVLAEGKSFADLKRMSEESIYRGDEIRRIHQFIRLWLFWRKGSLLLI